MARKWLFLFVLLAAVSLACQLTQSLQLSTLPGQAYWAAEPGSVVTPTYRVGDFYMNSDINVGGPDGIVLRVSNVEAEPNPTNPENEQYYYLFVTVKNYTAADIFVPVSDLFFIRRIIVAGNSDVRREWTAKVDPLLHRGLPLYDAQQLLDDGTPDRIAPGETRDFVVAFILPTGAVEEIGVATDLSRSTNGGLPLWIHPWEDPDGPFVDPCAAGYAPGCYPPPPTPLFLDESGTYGDAAPSEGAPSSQYGLWPTNGRLIRGYGCEPFYTGVDGTGFGCPSDKPWFHNGVDIANSSGNPIYSPITGVVEFASFNPTAPDCSSLVGSQPPHQGLGNYQRITNGETHHYLAHLSGFISTSGLVEAGEQVSTLGSSGCSTGPHLHWTLYEAGYLVDPAQWAGPGPPP